MKKLCAAIMACFIFSIMLTGCGSGNVGGAPVAPIEDVVLARAGNEVIMLSEYAYFFYATRNDVEQAALMQGYAPGDIAQIWQEEQDGITMEEMLREHALMVSEEYATLYVLARRAGAALSAEQIAEAEEAVQNVLDGISLDPNEAREAFIQNFGISPEQMLEIYQKLDLIAQYIEDLRESVVVTEDQSRAHFSENSERLEMVTVRHILISVDDDAQVSESEELALSLLARIQQGEDIGVLAAEYSTDPGSADNNGEYTFPRGVMVPEFTEWSFSAGIGEQGIVRTDFGFHVMQKMASLGFEDVRGQIEHELVEAEVGEILMIALEGAQLDWVVDETVRDTIRIEP